MEPNVCQDQGRYGGTEITLNLYLLGSTKLYLDFTFFYQARSLPINRGYDDTLGGSELIVLWDRAALTATFRIRIIDTHRLHPQIPNTALLSLDVWLSCGSLPLLYAYMFVMRGVLSGLCIDIGSLTHVTEVALHDAQQGGSENFC